MKKILLYMAIAVFLISLCFGLTAEYCNTGLWLFIVASLLIMFHVVIELREK